jgi:hypothetical protein
MLLAVCVVALLTAGLVTIRWTLTRVDSLGRHRTFPVVGTVLPLVVALVAGVPVVRHARLEAQLARVASTLAGHQVSVRCETLTQAWTSAHAELGYVRFGADGRPEPLATITVQACQDLSAWTGSRRATAPLAQLVAVHVLTHEAMHLAGQLDEARTECAAVQRDAWTATLLGATPEQGRALAVRYWRIVYPDLPPGYRTADCSAGASLDEGLADAPWAAAVKSS